MAWPTTKATTTALDQGSDNPNLARPEIKQNIDNVNSIIDEFSDVSISTPTDGQVLTYNDTNSRWENADATGGSGGGETVVYLGFDGTTSVDSSPWRYYHFTELSDAGSVATVTSGVLQLATGTYVMDVSTMYDTASNLESNPRLRNQSTSSNSVFPYKDLSQRTYTTTTDVYTWGISKFTVASASHNYILRYDSTTDTDPIGNIADCVIKLTKIS